MLDFSPNVSNLCLFDRLGIGIYSHVLQEHGEYCRYGPVYCENEGCSELLPPADVDRHTAEECLFRRDPCKHCGEEQAINQMEVIVQTASILIIGQNIVCS